VLFLTFAVVLVTLVGQGLTLPFVIRKLRLADAGCLERTDERAEELKVRRKAIASAIQQLESIAGTEEVAPEIVQRLRTRLRDRLTQTEWRADPDPGTARTVRADDALELRLIAA